MSASRKLERRRRRQTEHASIDAIREKTRVLEADNETFARKYARGFQVHHQNPSGKKGFFHSKLKNTC